MTCPPETALHPEKIWGATPARSTGVGGLLRITIAAMVLSLAAHAADGHAITARFVGVYDGDTLTSLADDEL